MDFTNLICIREKNLIRSIRVRNVNKVFLLGNVGSKPELRRTQSDIAVTDFPIAMTDKWKSKTGEDRTETTWIKVVCWGRLAENVTKYIETGDLVYVDGKISVRKYEREGQMITVTEIEATQVLRCNSKSRSDNEEPIKSDEE